MLENMPYSHQFGEKYKFWIEIEVGLLNLITWIIFSESVIDLMAPDLSPFSLRASNRFTSMIQWTISDSFQIHLISIAPLFPTKQLLWLHLHSHPNRIAVGICQNIHLTRFAQWIHTSITPKLAASIQFGGVCMCVCLFFNSSISK